MSNGLLTSRPVTYVIPVFCIALVLLVQGSIPFLTLPTLGQAVWSSGFALSFANNSLTIIHATNFGIPEPAAISFGLAAVYPQSLLIRAGIHPADAYSIIFATWFVIALLGAYVLSRSLGVSKNLSWLCAIAWMTFPFIWNHAGYSMLSLGIALLPFYLSRTVSLLASVDRGRQSFALNSIYYLTTTTIAVFMDGYSFVMFAVGSASVIVCFFFSVSHNRTKILLQVIPVQVLAFLTAYLLYTAYIGQSTYSRSPIEFFRAYGVDLSFLAIPSSGTHWLWDTIGFSVVRDKNKLFGDESVWITTFSAIAILSGLWAWSRLKRTDGRANCFLVLALLGFYMSLGPSLKINSSRPEGVPAPSMPAVYAVCPTGNAIISNKLPGFDSMRAAYRWVALGSLGCWLLLVLLLSHHCKESLKFFPVAAVSILLLSNMPHIGSKLYTDIHYRKQFFQMEREFGRELRKVTLEGDRVAFLPYGNDFMVNYFAPYLGVKTYNVGGDKNLRQAMSHWPEPMRAMELGEKGQYFLPKLLYFLATDEIDVAVIPHIDLLEAAHWWPPLNIGLNDHQRIREELSGWDAIEVTNLSYLSALRINGSLINKGGVKDRRLIESIKQRFCFPPYCISWNGSSRIWSEVGEAVESGIKTDGRAGYLIYGPYEEIEAGDYRLQLFGKLVGKKSGFTVDVVGRDLQEPYAVIEGMEEHGNDDSSILLDERVSVSKPDRIELRVHVEAETDLVVYGYTLKSVK